MSSTMNDKPAEQPRLHKPGLITIDELLARKDPPGAYGCNPDGWTRTKGKTKKDMFAELAAIEPRLNALLTEARKYKRMAKDAHHVCANDRWYGDGKWINRGLKEQLCRLVGFEAGNKQLRTIDAYDITYEYIYEALPNCKGCICMSAGHAGDYIQLSYKEVMLAYNPGTDQVRVGVHPDLMGWSNSYKMTVGGCFSDIKTWKPERLKMQVYLDAMHAVVRDKVDPLALHYELLKVTEYVNGCAGDMPSVVDEVSA